MSGGQVILIVGVAVVVGVATVALSALSLAGRVRPLRRALRRLSWRAEQAQQLQGKIEALQTRVAARQAELPASSPPRSGDLG